MSGRLIQQGSEAGAQTPPLLRASSPLKQKHQLRTNIEIGTANGGTSSALLSGHLWKTFRSKPNAIPGGPGNCSSSHRNRVRLQTGMLFDSQRNGVRLQIGIAFAFHRIPQLIIFSMKSLVVPSTIFM